MFVGVMLVRIKWPLCVRRGVRRRRRVGLRIGEFYKTGGGAGEFPLVRGELAASSSYSSYPIAASERPMYR